MSDDAVRIGGRVLIASRHSVATMRQRLDVVPVDEKADIAFRASAMVRQAFQDQQLARPLRGDLEDAVAMLLVLGVTTVHQ